MSFTSSGAGATLLCLLAIITCQCFAGEIFVAPNDTVRNCTVCITITEFAQLDVNSDTVVTLFDGNYTLETDIILSDLENVTIRGTDVLLDCSNGGFQLSFENVSKLFIEGITFVSCDSPGIYFYRIENGIFRDIVVTGSNGTAMVVNESTSIVFYNFTATNNNLWISFRKNSNKAIIFLLNSNVTFREKTTLSFNQIHGNISRPETVIMTCPEPFYPEISSSIFLANWTDIFIEGILMVVNNTSPTAILRIDQKVLRNSATSVYKNNTVGIYGALALLSTNADITGTSTYSQNKASKNDLAGFKTVAGMYIACSIVDVYGHTEFSHNEAGICACKARNSPVIIMRGVACFDNDPPNNFLAPPQSFDELTCATCIRDDFNFNSMMSVSDVNRFTIAGSEFMNNKDCFVLLVSRSMMHFTQKNTFKQNTVIIFARTSSFSFSGESFILNNDDRNSKTFSYSLINLYDQSQFSVSGYSLIKSNVRPYAEGAVVFAAERSEIIIGGNSSFEDNLAQVGGVCYLQDDSFITVQKNSHISFYRNVAQRGGGVLYLSRFETFCSYGRFSSNLPCFISYEDDSTTYIVYSGNRAANSTGSVIHSNIQISTGAEVKKRDYNPNISYENNTKPRLDSDFYQLFFCESRNPVYESRLQNRTVRRGEHIVIQVAAIAFFGGEGTRHLVRTSFTNTDTNIDHFFYRESHLAFDNCSDLIIQVFSPSSYEEIEISANGFCSDDAYCLKLNLTFSDCPEGQKLDNNRCVCDARLHPYTENCDVTTGEIVKTDNNPWIGAYRNTSDPNSTISGVIVYSVCPFDYCLDPQNIKDGVAFTLNNEDAQCSSNRMGRLCGACASGNSLGLHSSTCRDCSSNITITLILVMAALGIIFIVFVSLTKFTVSTGAIHGLLFYANVVGANNIRYGTHDHEIAFFDIFIGWLNLDFGFDICLHDGLTQALYIAYQFIFPLYLCTIVIFISLLCRFSIKASKFFSKMNDPVAMLETVILFSYTKIVRNIIDILSLAKLDYPPEAPYDYVIVWKRDGTIDYATGVHAVLVIVAVLLALVMILLTLIAVFSQWLYKIKAISKLFDRYHISAMLRTYHAAFKPGSRYWISLCLILRWILLLTSTLDENFYITLLTITTVCTILLSIIGIEGGIYNNKWLDFIEISFIVNLLLYSVGSYHVLATDGSSFILTYISTGTAFLTFLFILCVLIYLQLQKICDKQFQFLKRKFKKPIKEDIVTSKSLSLDSVVAREMTVVTRGPIVSRTLNTGQEISLARFSRLRETLLEDF